MVRDGRRTAPGTPTSWTRRSAAGSRERTRTEVLAAFEKAEAAVAPIQDVRDVMTDPQYAALDTSPPSTTRSSARCACRTSSSASPPPPARSAGRAARTARTRTEVLTELGLTEGRDRPALREEGAL